MTSSLSPLGLHRVLDPPGVLPQAAWRLDPSAAIAPDEVRVRVDRLNLDAASYRQLRETYAGDPDKIRAAVLEIIATRGKMQNPVTGSGGMLTGTVEAVGPDSPLGLRPGQRIATLVSLTLTPLVITDSLARWDGLSEQIPCEGHAILFARSIAAVLPRRPAGPLSLAVTGRLRRARADEACREARDRWPSSSARPARADRCPPPPPARPARRRSSASSRRKAKPPCSATPGAWSTRS